VLHRLARQVIGQRLAPGHLTSSPGRLWFGARRRGGCSCARLALCLAFLQITDDELELLDLAIQLLRRAAVARPLQHRELRLQLLQVQRLGVELGLQRHGEGPQRLGITREGGLQQRHERCLPSPARADDSR
jgi:hypothetical protein